LMPIDGEIIRTSEEHGEWMRPGFFKVPDQTKTGRLMVYITSRILHHYLSMWIEVGHGRYITDTIKLTTKRNELINAKSGIGEIVIGSLYEMHLNENGPTNTKTCVQCLVKPGTKVKAGETKIATIKTTCYPSFYY
jgi:hypothetical protein